MYAQKLLKKIGLFYQKLTDGTINIQRSDGSEIIASMIWAVLTSSGIVISKEVNNSIKLDNNK